MKAFKSLFWSALLLVSCSSPATDNSTVIKADIRKQLSTPTALKLNEEIESVSYIPLEITSDDASLVGGVLGYAVTDKYIYIHPIQGEDIVLFDRQGRFVKTLIRFGQGPGEFNGSFMGMRADEENNLLYVYSHERVFVYNLDGEFIKVFSPRYRYVFISPIAKNRLAAVGFPYMTFQEGNFGIGIFNENGDTIAIKQNFLSPLVPAEKSGFTMGLTAPAYSKQLHSVLFKTGSNDTIFRLSDDKILPACVLDMRNSDNEVVRSLDATDFSTLFERKFEEDGDIFVTDMFETTKEYYLRLRHRKTYYVASVNKQTGSTLIEKCLHPGSLEEISDANIQLGMMGSRSYNNFPIWGNMEGDYLVQLVTYYELEMYKDNPSVSIPEELSMDEESNPVIVMYKMKGRG